MAFTNIQIIHLLNEKVITNIYEVCPPLSKINNNQITAGEWFVIHVFWISTSNGL